MANIPINKPEDFCQEVVEIPACVQEFINALSPFQLNQIKDSVDDVLKGTSIQAEGLLEGLKQKVRDFIQNQDTQLQVAISLDFLGQALKCPGDPESCNGLTEAAVALQASLNNVTGQLQTLLGDEFIKEASVVAEKLTQKFLSLSTLKGFNIECPNEELDPNNAAEDLAAQFEDATLPGNLTNLMPGPPINNSLLLRWEPPADTSNLLGYEIYLNNVKVAFVPFFLNEFLLKNIPNDNPFKVKVVSINTDPVPVEGQPLILCGIQAGNAFPVKTPTITEALPFNGGFYLEWVVDPDIIDVNDFNDSTYTAVVVDSEQFFIVLNNDFQKITEVRNDSFPGFNLYNLSGADISIGSTFRATLDLSNQINQQIGLDRSDEILINFSDRQNAHFTFVSGNQIIIQLLNPELSSEISVQSITELRRLNVEEGTLDIFDLENLQILDYRTFQIDAFEASGFDFYIQLVSGIQNFETESFDTIEVDLLTTKGLQTFEGSVNTVSPLTFSIDPLEDSEGPILGVPGLVAIRNLTREASYTLEGSTTQMGRNFKLLPTLTDLLDVQGRIQRSVDYINPTTGLLTIIDTSFAEIAEIFNETKSANYSLSGINIFKGSTLIKLDPLEPTNALIGMRDTDLIRCKSDDATIAQFLINDPDSNQFTWKLKLNNFELGTAGFLKEIRSITNISRGAQEYDLTRTTFIDNLITIHQFDALNHQIGIDPRDEIRIDYTWERFQSIKAFEIFVDEDGAGYQFLQRTGVQKSIFDLGTRATLKGTKQELFTITLETNTLQLQCNDEIIELILQDGSDFTVIDLVEDIRLKAPAIMASTSSGYLILGCLNIFPRNPLDNTIPINIPNLPSCVNNHTCLVNDYIKILGGTALDILGFTLNEEAVGISFTNDLPLSLRVDALTADGRRQPFSLAGPNYAQVIPSKPIFNFENVIITPIQNGFLYNSFCGNPADIACYPQTSFAWVITFRLESPNRDIYSLKRLARASIEDITNQIISLPISIFSPDDILSVEKTADFKTYQSYDLTNIVISSGIDQTIIDLDHTLPINISLGMQAFDQIGVELPDFYRSTGLITHIPNLPKEDNQPLPLVTVDGTDVQFLTTEGFSTFGIDPFVKVRNLLATAPGYDPLASGLTFLQPISLSFEGLSIEGVDSASIWIKTKTKTFVPANFNSASLILQAGNNQPNEPGLYILNEAVELDITAPRYTRVQSVLTGVPSFLEDTEGLITTDGQFNGWVLEFISGIKTGLKYKIEDSTIANGFQINVNLSGVLANDIFAIHRRTFPNAWPNPASSFYDITTAPGIPGKITEIFDINDGFIILTLTLNGDIIVYVGDPSRETVVFSSIEAIRFNQLIDPNELFLIPGMAPLKFNDSYNPSDVDFLDLNTWDVSLLVQSTNPAPEIIIEATALTKLGEQVIGREIQQL